jgi:hypothetical protein
MHAVSGRSSHASHDALRVSSRNAAASLPVRAPHAAGGQMHKTCAPHRWLAPGSLAGERAVCLGADLSRLPHSCDGAPMFHKQYTIHHPPVRHAPPRGRLGVFAHYSCARATPCVGTLSACLTAACPLARRLQPQLPRASSPTARFPTNTARAPKHGAPGSPALVRLQQRPRAFWKPACFGLAPR